MRFHKGKNNRNEIIYGPSQGRGRPFRFWRKKSIPFKFSAKNTGVASLKSQHKCTLIALKVSSQKIRLKHLNFYTELRLFFQKFSEKNEGNSQALKLNSKWNQGERLSTAKQDICEDEQTIVTWARGFVLPTRVEIFSSFLPQCPHTSLDRVSPAWVKGNRNLLTGKGAWAEVCSCCNCLPVMTP